MVGFEVDHGSLFGKGNKVEVRSDEEGFKGAWYRATILDSTRKSVYKKKKKVMVEYETLVMEDRSSPLVENVDPAYIRPLPPEEESGCQDFEVNDIVDAAYRDGWWVGTVRKVLEGSRYRVYFDNPPDIIDFDGRDLRLHWDWIFGDWVRPPKELESAGISHNSEVAVLLESAGASLNSEADVQFEMLDAFNCQTRDKTLHLTSVENKLMEQPAAGTDIAPSYFFAAPNHCYTHSQPHKDAMQEDYEEVPLSAWKLKKGPFETSHGLSTPKKGGSVKRFSSSPAVNRDFSHPESSFSGNIVKAKSQNLDGLGGLKLNSATRNKRTVKSKSNMMPVSTSGKKKKTRDIASMDMNKDGAVVNDAGVPVIYALKAAGLRDSQAENSSQLQNDEPLKNEKSRRGSKKRKRGRPCKLVVTEPNFKEAGEVQQGAGGVGDCIFSEFIMPVVQQLDSTDSPGASVPGTAEVSQKDCTGTVVDTAITLVSDDITDDRPLSSWFGGDHSSTSLEEPYDSVPARTACLPFVKGSPIWETIESMEVFQIFPQEPHFYPLAERKEEHREGYAAGLMVTFANLFEKISTLQIDNPSSLFDSTLEALDDLEKYGFDVTRLKDRVCQLLSIKDGHMQLLNASKGFEEELMVHIQETTTLDDETREIERKMSEIQKQLEAIKGKKEAEVVEIAKLRSEMEVTNSCIQNICSDFQKQATASWKLP